MTCSSRRQNRFVRAFVGVLGSGSGEAVAPTTICGHAATTVSVGAATVTFVDHDAAQPFVRDGSADLAFYTGRPFFENRLLDEKTHADAAALDGKFARLAFSPEGIELATDWLGAGAIYHTIEGGRLHFATHLGLLLESLSELPDLNDMAVASLLFGRQQVFEEMHFAGTYRLPPAGRITASLDQDGKAKVDIDRGTGLSALLDVDAPAWTPDSLRDMIENGIERDAYDDQSVLMLSGGKDSLIIALTRAARPGYAATFGESFSMDMLRGKQRARRLDFEFIDLPYQDWTLLTYADEIVGLHAGCSGLQTAHNIVAFDQASHVADRASIGFLGDVFRGKRLDKLGSPDDVNLVRSLFLRERGDNRDYLSLYEKEWAMIKEHVEGLYVDLKRDHGSHRAYVLLKVQWMQSGWLSNTFDLCDWFLPVSYPFMQRDLLASWLQSDLASPQTRRVFDVALAQALAERGMCDDFRGTMPNRLWNRSRNMAYSVPRGRNTIGNCYWRSVIKRSQRDMKLADCGNERLNEVSRRSWQNAQSRKNWVDFPVVYMSAPIAAARARWGGKPTPRANDTDQTAIAV
ncbi:MAG: hypothetical protein AAF563_21630 [Pseudomonadota bacterium]